MGERLFLFSQDPMQDLQINHLGCIFLGEVVQVFLGRSVRAGVRAQPEARFKSAHLPNLVQTYTAPAPAGVSLDSCLGLLTPLPTLGFAPGTPVFGIVNESSPLCRTHWIFFHSEKAY